MSRRKVGVCGMLRDLAHGRLCEGSAGAQPHAFVCASSVSAFRRQSWVVMAVTV